MLISELVERLQIIEKQIGNLEVYDLQMRNGHFNNVDEITIENHPYKDSKVVLLQ